MVDFYASTEGFYVVEIEKWDSVELAGNGYGVAVLTYSPTQTGLTDPPQIMYLPTVHR